MILKCKYCNKEFKRYDIKSKNNYCSRECSAKARSTKVELNCDFCNSVIHIRKSELLTHKKHFCSTDCHNKYQSRNKVKRICKTCGKEFYKPISYMKQKKAYYCCLTCRNNDLEWCKESYVKANLIQCKKKGLNKLEIKGNEILDALGINYEVQKIINGKICVDVYIPSKNIIIQWDGNYWHGKDKQYEDLEPRIKKRVDLDKSQDIYLKKCGYTILRFWEYEVIRERNKVYEIIKRAIQ